MGLIISNLATDKQKAILQRLEYSGTGKYALSRLTQESAAELIDELFEEQRLEQRDNIQYTEDNKWD